MNTKTFATTATFLAFLMLLLTPTSVLATEHTKDVHSFAQNAYAFAQNAYVNSHSIKAETGTRCHQETRYDVCEEYLRNTYTYWHKRNPRMLEHVDLVMRYLPADQWGNSLLIAHCESRGDPQAYNKSGATGLFQIVRSWAMGQRWGRVFHEPDRTWVEAKEWLMNVKNNVQRAAQIFERNGGWGAWSASERCHKVK